MSVFSSAEFTARFERLRTAMRMHAVDVMILDDCEILAYFTGYETTLNLYRACIAPREGRPVMVLRALDAEPFRSQSWFQDHEAFADGDDPVEKLAGALGTRGFGAAAIGFDSGSHALSVAGYERLRGLLPDARFVPMHQVPWELRLVKSPAEIALIRRAAELLDQTLQEIIPMLSPGVTARDVAAAIGGIGRGSRSPWLRRGGAGMGFPACAVGGKSARSGRCAAPRTRRSLSRIRGTPHALRRPGADRC